MAPPSQMRPLSLGRDGCSPHSRDWLGLCSVSTLLGCQWAGDWNLRKSCWTAFLRCCGMQAAAVLGISGVGAEANGHLALGASCSGVGAARSPAGAWSTCPGPDVHSGLSQDMGFHRTQQSRHRLPHHRPSPPPPSGGSPRLQGSRAIPRVGGGSIAEHAGAEDPKRGPGRTQLPAEVNWPRSTHGGERWCCRRSCSCGLEGGGALCCKGQGPAA